MGNSRVVAVSSFVFVALFHSVLPCPPFHCGKLGDFSFPFTNRMEDIECGPFVLDDCEKEHQRINLNRGSKKWYKVEKISPIQGISYNITVTDTDLQEHLNSSFTICDSFRHPSFQFFPYEIFPKPIILYKCESPLESRFIHFDFDYNCHYFRIYYNYANRSLSPDPPPGCSIIRLPVNPKSSFNNILKLLTATFSFDVLPDECNRCPLGEGKCKFDWDYDEYKCFDDKGREIAMTTETTKEWKWKLGLGMGCSAIIVEGLMLIFFWHRYKRNDALSRFHRANTHSADFSSPELDKSNIFFGIPVFSYMELQEATNDFASENELGDGGFGIVYYGMLKDGREVAVKRLYERNYSTAKQFLNEIEILTRLHHKNLVSIYGCTSRRSSELLLVYEYIPNGTVADHLHGDRACSNLLTWPIRMRIAVEAASALVYLHASGIVHRDVKTNNILLDNHFCVKVADFGISRLFPDDVTHISTVPQGTPGYVDPEYHQCYQLTEKSDVYSFGVVLVELISSMPAVDITRHRHEINLADLAINKIQTSSFDELIDPSLVHQSDEEVKRMMTSVAKLAFLCLEQDKEMRPAMDEVLEELKRIQGCKSESDNLKEEYDDA